MRILSLIIATALTAMLCGCKSPVPTYANTDPAASLGIIADGFGSVRTISSRCDILLTDSRGESVRLDGALAAAPPDRLRLRAWKFDHAVLDLTLVGDEAWLLSPSEEEDPDRARRLKAIPADRIGEVFALLGPDYFRAARILEDRTTPSTLFVAAPALGHSEVVCEIDRRTLTPRRFSVPGSATTAPAELHLDRYTPFPGGVWPSRITLASSEGSIVVYLDGVEINTPLPDAAFTPPRRATRLP